MKRKKDLKISKKASACPGEKPVALQGDLQRIAEIAGVEAALKIAREFRGTHLYIPDVFKKVRDEEIRKEYDGGLSARSLAIKHRIAERTVWDILKKPSKENPSTMK